MAAGHDDAAPRSLLDDAVAQGGRGRGPVRQLHVEAVAREHARRRQRELVRLEAGVVPHHERLAPPALLGEVLRDRLRAGPNIFERELLAP